MDRELAEEMRDHLERKAAKNAASGMTREEAVYAARRQLGNATLQREQSRLTWGFPSLESWLQDLRFGLRVLRKASGFSTVAILTLALGLGATTAIFSIVNTIVLRPLPYKNSERLVALWTKSPMFPEFNLGESKGDFDDIKSQSQAFETMAMYRTKGMTLSGNGEPERVVAVQVTPGFLDLFGVRPEMGRDIEPDDEHGTSGTVVLLSQSVWRQRFAADPHILGRQLTLDQKAFTVVGVLPRGFDFPVRDAFLVPLSLRDDERQSRGFRFFRTIGRLRPGTSLQSAQAELDAISARLSSQYPGEDSGVKFNAFFLQSETVGEAKSSLMVLLGAVTFLMLIACANVGNLLLAKGTQRQKEISIRTALGCTRPRIVRQLLVESLLLAFLGGAAGLLVAVLGVDAFKALAPNNIPRISELRIEPAIAWFAFVFASCAGMVCGLAPALHTTRIDLTAALKDRMAAWAPRGPRRFSLRSFLVVFELALALVLLTGSALMVQSLVRTLKVDPGFATDHLLTAQINLSAARYSTDEAAHAFLERLFAQLQARHELSRSAVSNYATLDGMLAIYTFDPATLGLNEKPTNLEYKAVDPHYFETMGIPLLAGRVFTERDTAVAPPVAIVSESVVRRFFPGQNPLGKELILDSKRTDSKSHRQIVGVVADVRDVTLRDQARPELYTPLLEQRRIDGLHLYVRTQADDPEQLASSLRQCIWSVDKDMPVTHVGSVAAAISQTVAEPRFRTWLLSLFAAAGLSLTLIGIYGVISYSVSQRTREIGVRVALGAPRERVLRLILGQGLRLALLGAAIGLAGSLALTRVIASELFGVKPADPATLVGAVLSMLGIALVAAYLPARRATRVDPVIALRHE
jgi:putative ABC transport system permease protein